jgi:hypothetical protein
MTDAWQIPGTQLVPSTGRPWDSIPGWPYGPADRDATRDKCEWELASDAIPPPGAHLITSRVGYTHHGIHVGDGRVVHYSGLSRGWRGGPVEEVSLAEFARGRPIRIRIHTGARFDPDAVIARARSRLGESRYRTLTNNCEHLCEWCIYGQHRSRQVEVMRSRSLQAVQTARRLAGAPLRLLSLAQLALDREVL